MMLHSTVTGKGQTTIPKKIRDALRIKPGGKIEYAVVGDYAIIRVHPGIRSLKGVLASKKGKGGVLRRNPGGRGCVRRQEQSWPFDPDILLILKADSARKT